MSLPAEKWRLCLLSVEPAAVDLAVCAARHNVALTGIHSGDHHAALIASLHIGCNAYSTSTEARAGANIILACELPAGEQNEVLSLVFDGAAGLRCRSAQRDWAEDFLRYIETPITLLAP